MTVCDECSAPIDERTGYCISCGLESLDYKDRQFDRHLKAGARDSGSEESRQRIARKRAQYGSGRGFVCHRCKEMFEMEEDNVHELNAMTRGFEQPGTIFYRFLTKQELSDHITAIHGGKRLGDKFTRSLKSQDVANTSQKDGENGATDN